MNVSETGLPGVLLIEPAVFVDERGVFVETFRSEALLPYGVPTFVQDNHSRSRRGVLRGLHYQLSHAQGKLIRAARGRVFDVAVDLRRGSPNFGRWLGVVLDDVAHRQLYIPPGFAHGFVALSAEADCVYKCSDYYHPAAERGIAWNDPDIAIQWPPEVMDALVLSDRDRHLPLLREQALENLPICSEAPAL